MTNLKPSQHPTMNLRPLLLGPWRALPVLGLTQILAWGALYYPPVLTVPLIAAERGWPLPFAMAGLSAALLAGGVAARKVGSLIDRRGGHVVMACGSLIGAAGLAALAWAPGPLTYLAAWVICGVAMAASLYDPAFATLGRIFGQAARRPITLLTFVGGFASTVSWPATHLLIGAVGWRGTYLVYAVLLACVAAPLHALALPRPRAEAPAPAHPAARPAPAAPALPPGGWPFYLVMAGFAAYAFIPSGLSAHLLAIFGRAGLRADTVVLIGALFGPAQVLSRMGEFLFAGQAHPVVLARFALGVMAAAFALLLAAGVSAPVAIAFMLMFGMCNGLITIARGTLPLALFGATGFGLLTGRLAGPWLAMQAAGPPVLAFVAEHASDRTALALAAAFALLALGCFAVLRRAGSEPR